MQRKESTKSASNWKKSVISSSKFKLQTGHKETLYTLATREESTLSNQIKIYLAGGGQQQLYTEDISI